MNKLIIMASVVVLAASSAACGSRNDSDSPSGAPLVPVRLRPKAGRGR